MNLSENRERAAPAELKPHRNKALDAKILAKMREVNNPVLKQIRKYSLAGPLAARCDCAGEFLTGNGPQAARLNGELHILGETQH